MNVEFCSYILQNNTYNHLSVLFMLFHLPVIYRGTVIFTNMFRIQHRTRMLEDLMYLGACSLSCAHLNSQGLMVMTWKILRRQVLPIHTALPTL